MAKLTQILAKQLSKWRQRVPDSRLSKSLAKEILKTTEEILSTNEANQVPNKLWHRYLTITGKHDFLQSLANRALQYRWSETTFQIIQISNYTLKTMFDTRVNEHPQRVLFQDMSTQVPVQWSYEQISRHVAEIAAAFISVGGETLRVAILSENNIESACCDLACLLYDIFDAPLNIHFETNVIADIFRSLDINIAVTDSPDRWWRLEKIRKDYGLSFSIFVTNSQVPYRGQDSYLLGEYCKRLDKPHIQSLLRHRAKKPIDQVCTTMFTSGSTGSPKGVSFSQYNLVSKRFARAAVLPNVGKNEVLLCYLPLYHTFGRYFEMLGSIYWGATYVLAGNPSTETIRSLFQSIHPTGFISVPVRWEQIYEACLEILDSAAHRNVKTKVREIVGERLHWGISAAGYLDPKVFRFFQRNGVNLCSGFGMTEATGGVTMTPPGKYRDNSTGMPLPGIYTNFSKKGELKIRGHYVARYLEDKGPDNTIPFPHNEQPLYWLSTGDLFRVSKDGYLEIIDRVKDIYKNNRGQTIAPRRVEQKFFGVAGIKQAFLVGDGRAYNVLLIVPDLDDPMIKSRSTTKVQEYFHQLVTTGNQNLAPYERVVNFAILNRDFEISKKELTPKGSFNRKVIEAHFKDIIEELYRRDYVQLQFKSFSIHIPRWIYRDQGILEDAIIVTRNGLLNTVTNEKLPIKISASSVQIGDLEYQIWENSIDLGLFARQPKLWIGNPALISFCPCKDGWDIPYQSVSPLIFRPWKISRKYTTDQVPTPKQIQSQDQIELNQQVTIALFADARHSLTAIERLREQLVSADDRVAEVIRRRLEALARHPSEKVRCLAYQVLLLDEPVPDYGTRFPAFVSSGQTFLTEKGIEAIAFSKLENRRLSALRQRLFSYRIQLKWPTTQVTRQQFVHIFKLLVSFVNYHPEFYYSVRAELSSWILHKSDTELAQRAEDFYTKLANNFEQRLLDSTPSYSKTDWTSRLVFDDGLSRTEIFRIKKVLVGTTFLKQSIILAFDEKDFDLNDVPSNGIWISRIQCSFDYLYYRIKVNTKTGRHFDLQLILREKLSDASVLESIYWLAAIAGYPHGPTVLPRLGCYRPELGARSMAFLGDLTVWEKIQQFSSQRTPIELFPQFNSWRKLFIEALTVFFQGWRNSGNKVVPGVISPNNVVVPELDFRESATILTISGWFYYKNTLSLVKPMLQNFYRKTIAHYPWCKEHLDVTWIFDACIEALGQDRGSEFLSQLTLDLVSEPVVDFNNRKLSEVLADYVDRNVNQYYLPLPLHNAIERYSEWYRQNPSATASAREQTVIELINLYRLERFPEIIRYNLYRNTYFSNAPNKVLVVFDRLLDAMMNNRQKRAIQFVELSDLQDTITNSKDRNVFSRMIFPRFQNQQTISVTQRGDSDHKQVIVSTNISDKQGVPYTCREPIEPSEIGQLYQLFFKENIPVTSSELGRQYVVIDRQDRIIAGLFYRFQSSKIVQIDNLAVISQLKGRGIASALINDFCDRMASQNVNVIKAHLFPPSFFIRHGFKVDKRWGALVKILSQEKRPPSDVQEEIITPLIQ